MEHAGSRARVGPVGSDGPLHEHQGNRPTARTELEWRRLGLNVLRFRALSLEALLTR